MESCDFESGFFHIAKRFRDSSQLLCASRVIPFYCWMSLCCLDVPQFTHPFTCDRTCGSLQFLTTVNKGAKNINVQLWGKYKFSFL